MKHLLILLSAMLLAAIGWWLGSPGPPPLVPNPTQAAHPPPTSTVNDPVTVFQNAFWKRPTAEDHILNAERREWRDGTAISRWQWFISVKPSPLLVAHLITDNAFALSPSLDGMPRQAENAPIWFPEEADTGVQVFTENSGAFTLIWDEQDNLLHATGSGGGFHHGAPETAGQPPVAPAQPMPAGRIPTTPPPKP